jgi:hypothetical protein
VVDSGSQQHLVLRAFSFILVRETRIVFIESRDHRVRSVLSREVSIIAINVLKRTAMYLCIRHLADRKRRVQLS